MTELFTRQPFTVDLMGELPWGEPFLWLSFCTTTTTTTAHGGSLTTFEPRSGSSIVVCPTFLGDNKFYTLLSTKHYWSLMVSWSYLQSQIYEQRCQWRQRVPTSNWDEEPPPPPSCTLSVKDNICWKPPNSLFLWTRSLLFPILQADPCHHAHASPLAPLT